MQQLKITFPDGKQIEVVKGTTLLDVAKKISTSFAKKVIAAQVNETKTLKDISDELTEDTLVNFITIDSKEAFEIINHSCAHLMASAIEKLYPNAKFAYGPNVEEGFYYDIKTEEQITEKDLSKIEREMQKIVKNNVPFIKETLSRDEMKKAFSHDEFKQVLIDKIPDGEELTVYAHGDFKDLCRGVHVPGTKFLKNFKLLKVAGAYFLGDDNNEMLTRVYGICFGTEEQLKAHLHMLEEAEKRDHRKLGSQLGLFMVSEYGPGFPFFLPNGVTLKRELLKYWEEEHLKLNYKLIETPAMLNKTLWETSGHWFNYRENMYTSNIDKHEFAIKPMNCPGSLLVYKNDLHSYKQLPLRMGELGHVHRHEASGALHGLMRVRSFTQDDAHIFMTPNQIEDIIIETVELFDRFYTVFDLPFHIELSTMPEKAIGSKEVWEKAETALANAMNRMGREFIINEGDGAFYGPKLDFKLRDAIGRVWQCGTIQLDFNLPERFEITYISEDGSKQQPVMIHRAMLGSIERFLGILIEHYAGAFPLWLAPVQVKAIPVSLDAHADYVNELVVKLKQNGLRVETDLREEKLGKKIREAQMLKIPYSLVIGDNEKENGEVTYRKHGSQEQITVSFEKFVNLVKEEIANKGK